VPYRVAVAGLFGALGLGAVVQLISMELVSMFHGG
jgi:hypothetical protein